MTIRQWDIRTGVCCGLTAVALVAGACASRNEVSQPQAPQPGSESELPRPVTPVSVEQTPATPPVPLARPTQTGVADSSARANLAAPGERSAGVVQVCNQMCDSMAKSCDADAVKNCRRNCTRYEQVPAECRATAKDALACARDAEDLLCIEMAPASCMAPFKAHHDCVADPQGYSPAGSDGTEPQNDWQLVKDATRKFSVEFPVAPQQVSMAESTRWVVGLGQAKLYATSYEAPQYTKLDMKLMKSGEKLLGKCSEDYRLRGQYETPGAVHVSFVARCKDGTQWTGKLHLVGGSQVFVTAVEGKGVDEATISRFFESFKQL